MMQREFEIDIYTYIQIFESHLESLSQRRLSWRRACGYATGKLIQMRIRDLNLERGFEIDTLG